MAGDPLAWIDEELVALDAANLRRHLTVRSGPRHDGQLVSERQTLIDFSSNDYLGLAAEPLTTAVRESLVESGWGSGASPLISGRGVLHARLEQQLANFENTESALLFSSGFAANAGTIAALVGRGDVIFSDANNHASIIDGCRLAGARIQIYPHCDVDYLHNVIRQAKGFRRRLIVSDSLFSMDGDLAPIDKLAELAARFDAMLMIDEAHATGVFGENGRGVAEHLEVEDGVHVRVGTLSKALGSSGGFVAGRKSLVDWLSNRARPYVFSTASPEAVAAAGIRALEIVRDEPERRKYLLEQSRQVRERLKHLGWRVGDSPSQIIPVRIGDAGRTMMATALLRDRGLLVPGIRPPSVPDGQSLLRISLNYLHSPETIGRLCEEFGRIAPKFCDA